MKKIELGFFILFLALLVIVAGYLLKPHIPFSPANSYWTLSSKTAPINKELYTYQGVVSAMPYRVSIENISDVAKRNKCELAIQKIFQNTDAIFNRWNPHSELSRFNDFKSTHPIAVDPDLRQLLLLAGIIHRHSNGLYDPTILPLVKVWRESLQKNKLPSQEEISQIKRSVGWEKLQFKTRNRLQKLNSNLEIDLRSLIKGYTVDLICEYLMKEGYRHIYVEWGGEVRVKGGHPLNRAWIVGIKNPMKKKHIQYTNKISLYQGAISTSFASSEYYLVRQEDGSMKAYTRLINPRTLAPIETQENGIISCSVIAPSCALADGLSTAGLLQISLDEAQEWARHIIHEFEDVEIYFYCKDGKLWHFEKAQTKSQLVLY